MRPRSGLTPAPDGLDHLILRNSEDATFRENVHEPASIGRSQPLGGLTGVIRALRLPHVGERQHLFTVPDGGLVKARHSREGGPQRGMITLSPIDPSWP